MAKYAEGTTVSPEKSRMEIEKILIKYGATKFVSGWEADRATIVFELKNRRIRFTLPFPDLKEFRYSGNNRYRTEAQMKVAQQAEIRRLWRSLVLSIKSKLEVIESGISTFEKEFLADTLVPGNETYWEWSERQHEQIVASGQMPPLQLPAPH